jgi:hypothetical protein
MMDFEADSGQHIGLGFVSEEYVFDILEFYEWNG